MTTVDRDRQRRRGRDARRSDRLEPEATEGFANGGLGALDEALDLRIRFRPGESPLAHPNWAWMSSARMRR